MRETSLKPVSCLINDFFFFMSDIKEDYDLSGYVPNFPFPVAACKVTQCSTLAVVCRLKSHRHVVTNQKSELVCPEFPLAKVTFPQNAIPQEESFEVTAKVCMARVNYPCIYIVYFYLVESLDIWDCGLLEALVTEAIETSKPLVALHFPADSPSFRRRFDPICITRSIKILYLLGLLKTGKQFCIYLVKTINIKRFYL